MLSMTGYGRGEYKENGIELTVEIKTVNNRYLDVSIKAPRIFVGYEEVMRSVIRGKVSRGHADVFVTLSDRRERAKTLWLDEAAAKAYVNAAKEISALFPEVENDLTVSTLLRNPDILKQEEVAGADEQLLHALDFALNSALESLNKMREAEGAKLRDDMLSRVSVIENTVNAVSERAPLVVADYSEKLTEKIKTALSAVQVDEGRLLTEVALFADKSNIDEELTRLRSHIVQFRKICESEQVGRKLDFLVQEFNRESNTICSKSNDVEVTRLALSLKNEIEKIREQVQNVE